MKNILYILLLLYILFIMAYMVVGRIIKKRRYAKIIREYEINFKLDNAITSKKRKKFHK